MHHKTQQLKDYLNGMKRNNRLALERLDTISNWPELLRREVERRAIHAIEILPDDLLVAIAKGEVNIQRAIREVLAD
ncbi:hypothetical protein [Lysobacter sp. CA199]|uniref:hypothetical protein n=1 Tax=Lysobacter sp. CA199 TaxID=3455608 RepID=UPI003F8D57FD